MTAVPRDAARALVLDPDDRVLLVRYVHPDTGEEFWTTPGGGIDPGEEPDDALVRELREETGLEDVELGPVIWTRREVFPWAGRILDQSEQIVLVRVPWFEPQPHLTAEQLAAEGVYEQRWWTLRELEASSETFYPTRLAALVRELLEHGPPDQPIDAGI
ncbi:MAG: NUDIX domain-containing protein [Actinomycetota bacterium]|nr:NUDIX domain-containing protein [Actinomycetota bacterium]